MSNQWTKEQLSAIETRNTNLLVSAAAGSGKTAVLVERIIQRITKDQVDIDALLVMTFTNAAAAEMRERIGEAVIKALEEDSGNRNLERQLTLLNRSSIMTIHSFCLEVIRSHFHEIGLDPGFRIADETEGAIMREEALEEALEESYEIGSKEFISLVDAYGGKRDDKELGELVLNLYHFIMSHPWPYEWLEEKVALFDVSGKSFTEIPLVEEFMEELQETLKPYLNHIDKGISLTEDDALLFPYAETLREDRILLEELLSILQNKPSFNEIKDYLEGFKWSMLKRGKKGYDKVLAEMVKGLREEVKDAVKGLKANYFAETEEEHLAMLKVIYPHLQALKSLTELFMEKYSRKKREKSLLDFSDLEHLALKILTVEEDGRVGPSDVAKFYKEKYEDVLVDEYQDSNEVQEVLITMVSRKEEENPNVFMVGDVKQSIYRFRQAKPELFMEKYKAYSEDGNERGKKILLYKNFRSRNNILSFVNFIFEGLMSEKVGELEYTKEEALIYGATYYEEVENHEPPVKEAEPVELLLLEEKSALEDSEVDTDEEGELDLSAYKSIEVEARLVAGRINELIKSGFLVFDKEIKGKRPVTYRDIVILMRATSRTANIFLEALHENNIPSYSDSSTGYFDTIEIRTMLSLLKVIDNPLQDIPLLSVLRSPLFSFSEEELVEIRKVHKDEFLFHNLKSGSFEKALSEKVDQFKIKLELYRLKSRFMKLDEFIWYLYTDTSYLDYVSAMPDGLERQANLKLLFQRAKQFEETTLKGLFNFIRFIDKLKKSSGDYGAAKMLGENENLVRIMSIHKSKGLEFPVVFLVHTSKRFNKMDLNKSMILHESLGFGPSYVDMERNIKNTTFIRERIKRKRLLESLSEEMRILYVALTRAKEKLIITGQVKSLEKSMEKWTTLSQGEGFRLSSEKVEKGSSYLDWMMSIFLKHHALSENRADGERYSFGKDVALQLFVHTKEGVMLDQIEEEGTEEGVFTLHETRDPASAFLVQQRLAFQYKFEKDTKRGSKISVTELKKLRALGEEIENTQPIIKDEFLERPRFLMKDKGLKATERGTAFHKAMQYISLQSGSVEEIKNDLQGLVLRELMTEEEVSAVNPWKILQLLESDLGKRMQKAELEGNLYREQKFILYFDESEVMVVGVIDSYFRENNELVIVDYKTDRVIDKDAAKVLTDRYKEQLDYYSEALMSITGLKVKESYLYSVENSKEICIN